MVTTALLLGELRTGRITATLAGDDLPTDLRWTDVLNNSGSIDGVTIPEAVVRKYDLRGLTNGARCFMAVEQDGRIKQAGPIWSRTWDWQKGELTLSASGMWSMADKRIIYDSATFPSGILSFTGVSLGGLAVSLVSHMMGWTPPYTNLPIVLPTIEAGDHEESFPQWNLSRYGEQLRQITQRATDAPDIAFRARRTAADPRIIEWVMQVGTEAFPQLSQGGPDWVFDTSAPRSPVLGIATDEDANDMGEVAWASGNGSEADMKLVQNTSTDGVALLDMGWPYMEVDESHSTVEDNFVLLGHVDNMLARSTRPIEVFKVMVSAAAAREVTAGDFCRVVTDDDVWLGSMDRTMRIKQVSGGLEDSYVLEMFPMAGLL